MICVDRLRDYTPTRRWPFPQACHMVADNLDAEELHAFARKLGLKRAWFQNKPGQLPHYDLNATRRAAAVALGAREITDQELVAIIRAHRQTTLTNDDHDTNTPTACGD